MKNYLVEFVVNFVLESGEDAKDAINEVLFDHNSAVLTANAGGGYRIDTGQYSDKQCLLSSLLDKNTTYQPIR